MWIQFLIGVLLILLGVAVRKFKWYFLIAGYNTMSKERKANVDTEGLGRLIGLYLYFNGGILMLLGILDMLKIWSARTPFMMVIGVSTIYLLIRAQKYDHNIADEKGITKKGADKKVIASASMMMVIFLAVGGLLFYASRPVEVTISSEGLQIHGMYGEFHPWDSFEEVELHEELPQIERRTNGSGVGSSLKGHFRTTELGDVKLFVKTSKPPFIYITTEGRMTIFNGVSEEETRQIFEAIEGRIHR